MYNEKTDGERQVCNGKTSGVESTAEDRTHVATPEATASATKETASMESPASKAETVANTPTTAAVAAPTASEQCISGSTNTAAATIVPAVGEHMQTTAATKWIPATAVQTTKWRMTRRGDRKL